MACRTRVRLCKPFKEPRNRFPARYDNLICSLAESIPWNRFLGSLYVYKSGLCTLGNSCCPCGFFTAQTGKLIISLKEWIKQLLFAKIFQTFLHDFGLRWNTPYFSIKFWATFMNFARNFGNILYHHSTPESQLSYSIQQFYRVFLIQIYFIHHPALNAIAQPFSPCIVNDAYFLRHLLKL
jgi:hypothetical protein